MVKHLQFLVVGASLSLSGCGSFVTDSVIEPYKLESYKRLEDAALVNGVRVRSTMLAKTNHIYGTAGPFSVAIICDGMRGSDKVAAIHSLQVTSGKETLFTSEFRSLRSSYLGPSSPGARRYAKTIGSVQLTDTDDGALRFNFGRLIQVEHRLWRTVTVRAEVEVSGGGSSESREVVFHHRPKTKWGIWQWYPPT